MHRPGTQLMGAYGFGTTKDCPVVLEPGKECTVDVTFAWEKAPGSEPVIAMLFTRRRALPGLLMITFPLAVCVDVSLPDVCTGFQKLGGDQHNNDFVPFLYVEWSHD